MNIVQSSYDFFFSLLAAEARGYHKLSVEEHIFLSHFLQKHIDVESFFIKNEDNKLEKATLAFLLKNALEEQSLRERKQKYQLLGETALHTLGVFPLSLERSLVGADYYTSMGSKAFASVYDLSKNPLFFKLADNFPNLVDLLNVSLAIKLRQSTTEDIQRIWSITRSSSLAMLVGSKKDK